MISYNSSDHAIIIHGLRCTLEDIKDKEHFFLEILLFYINSIPFHALNKTETKERYEYK